jgi:hypothetical protein
MRRHGKPQRDLPGLLLAVLDLNSVPLGV